MTLLATIVLLGAAAFIIWQRRSQSNDVQTGIAPKSGLMICKDCGKEISKRALKCPHCGRPVRRNEQLGCVFLIALFIAALMIAKIFTSID